MMWQRRDDWIGSQVDDSFVMINLDHGSYVALNATAADTWELLAEPQDEDALVDALVGKFDVDPAHCRRVLRTLLDDMVARELVRSIDTPAPQTVSPA